MSGYLPLCALRQDLLPSACRSCAWWLTSGPGPAGREEGHAKRHQWMLTTEASWGSTGLIDPATVLPSGEASLDRGGSIQFAPVAAIPRLRNLPLGPLPADSAVIFCLRIQDDNDKALARRLLQKSLGQLRERKIQEAYAFASLNGGAQGGDECEFFDPGLLRQVGFVPVRDNGQLFLMKVDLRGLATILTQIQTRICRAFHHQPACSPTACDGRVVESEGLTLIVRRSEEAS